MLFNYKLSEHEIREQMFDPEARLAARKSPSFKMLILFSSAALGLVFGFQLAGISLPEHVRLWITISFILLSVIFGIDVYLSDENDIVRRWRYVYIILPLLVSAAVFTH